MIRLVLISLVCVILSAIVENQRKMVDAYHHRLITNQPVAEDRRYHWIKDLKKQEKLKIRHLKKHFRKCGIAYPLKFKLFRRSDDGDFDTIHIMVPYGYSGEYFPQPQVNHQASTTPRFIYSVKYRETPVSQHEPNSTNFELIA